MAAEWAEQVKPNFFLLRCLRNIIWNIFIDFCKFNGIIYMKKFLEMISMYDLSLVKSEPNKEQIKRWITPERETTIRNCIV